MVDLGRSHGFASLIAPVRPSLKHRCSGALTLVSIDVEADTGVYVEPNVWMRHRL